MLAELVVNNAFSSFSNINAGMKLKQIKKEKIVSEINQSVLKIKYKKNRYAFKDLNHLFSKYRPDIVCIQAWIFEDM